LGATIVDPADLPSAEEIFVSKNESVVTNVDFKVIRPNVPTRKTDHRIRRFK